MLGRAAKDESSERIERFNRTDGRARKSPKVKTENDAIFSPTRILAVVVVGARTCVCVWYANSFLHLDKHRINCRYRSLLIEWAALSKLLRWRQLMKRFSLFMNEIVCLSVCCGELRLHRECFSLIIVNHTRWTRHILCVGTVQIARGRNSTS